jgi:hypothetical protein
VFVLLVPPVFVLGPLAGLLLVSRPSTGREWFWLVASGTLLVLSLRGEDLASGFISAMGLFVAGAFVSLSLWRANGVFTRAARAAAAGVVAALALAAFFGAGWAIVEQALAGGLRDAFLAQARLAEAADVGQPVVLALQDMARDAGRSASFYPALLTLVAIAGCALAWRWYGLVATRPIGPTGSRFAGFRFSDQAIWILVVALAVTLMPFAGGAVLGAPLRTWGKNLLVVMVALYAAQGLAVALSAARRTPRRIVAVLGVVAMLLWPFAAGGLVLLGLADSWIDFRRRLESPPTGGWS